MLNRLNKPIISLILAFCMLAGVMSLVFVSAITPTSGVMVGDVVYEDVRVGDTVTYTVNLTAAEKFYGVEAEITYDSAKLSIVPRETKAALVSFKGGLLSMNTDKDGIVKFSAAGTSKYNFITEKPLITLDFVVKDTTYSEIDLSVKDIWIDGYGADERWYFKEYEPVITEGIAITQTLAVTDRPEVPIVTGSSGQTEAETTQELTTEPATPAPTEPTQEQNTPKKGIGVGSTVYYIADAGDRVVYTVSLKAEKLFEDIDATVTYDSEKLEPATLYENGNLVTDVYAQGRWMCPNLGDPVANSAVDGIIKLSDAYPEGNDFKDGKVLFEIEFVVKDSAYSEIRLRIDEMSVKGGEDDYFSGGIALITEGIEISEKLNLGSKPVIVPPQTQPATDATEPSAELPTQEPATLPTDGSSTHPFATEQTEKTEAQTRETQQTEESEAQTSEVRQTEESSSKTSEMDTVGNPTTGHSHPTEADTRVVYLVGDANSDQKINVKDATVIQKASASLVTLSDVQTLAADCDGNALVNVRDATAVQKFVANLETGLPIGEERTK